MARGSIITRPTKAGVKRFAAVIRIQGNGRWKTFDKKRDAESYLERTSSELRAGTFRELKPATFAQYIALWKVKNFITPKLKPATLHAYGSAIACHLLPAFKALPLAAIDAGDITMFEAKLLRAGQSPKSTRCILQLLNRILKNAKRDGYLRISPMEDIELMKIERQEARVLSPAEVQEVIELVAFDPELRAVVMLALLAGLRRGEIFGLQREDIDRRSKQLYVRHSLARHPSAWILDTPKTKASIRRVDLSPRLFQELDRFLMQSPHKTGLIFRTATGGPIDPNHFYSRRFKRALSRRPDLADVGLHTLRHTFGSAKLEHGASPAYVSKQMGHANVSITMNVYAHLVLSDSRPDVAAATDWFFFGRSGS